MFISSKNGFIMFAYWCHLSTLFTFKLNEDCVEIIHWGSCFGAIVGFTLSLSLSILAFLGSYPFYEKTNSIGVFLLVSTPLLIPLTFYLISAWLIVYIIIIGVSPQFIKVLWKKYRLEKEKRK